VERFFLCCVTLFVLQRKRKNRIKKNKLKWSRYQYAFFAFSVRCIMLSTTAIHVQLQIQGYLVDRFILMQCEFRFLVSGMCTWMLGFFVGMLFYGHVARTLRFWIRKRAHELCMAVSKPLKNFASLFRWCWSAGCGSAQLHTIAQVLTSNGGVGACRLPILFQISFCILPILQFLFVGR
jgi:hypothetical protein